VAWLDLLLQFDSCPKSKPISVRTAFASKCEWGAWPGEPRLIGRADVALDPFALVAAAWELVAALRSARASWEPSGTARFV
jgi:hypothetical protein